jgi:hypothetical protein
VTLEGRIVTTIVGGVVKHDIRGEAGRSGRRSGKTR